MTTNMQTKLYFAERAMRAERQRRIEIEILSSLLATLSWILMLCAVVDPPFQWTRPLRIRRASL